MKKHYTIYISKGTNILGMYKTITTSMYKAMLQGREHFKQILENDVYCSLEAIEQ